MTTVMNIVLTVGFVFLMASVIGLIVGIAVRHSISVSASLVGLCISAICFGPLGYDIPVRTSTSEVRPVSVVRDGVSTYIRYCVDNRSKVYTSDAAYVYNADTNKIVILIEDSYNVWDRVCDTVITAEVQR